MARSLCAWGDGEPAPAVIYPKVTRRDRARAPLGTYARALYGGFRDEPCVPGVWTPQAPPQGGVEVKVEQRERKKSEKACERER